MDMLEAFYGANAGYVVELYERYLRDPASVDPESRQVFAQWHPTDAMSVTAHAPQAPVGSDRNADRAARVAEFARALRARGHLIAALDPLGAPPPGEPDLDESTWGITAQDLQTLPASIVDGPVGNTTRTAAEAIERLRRI